MNKKIFFLLLLLGSTTAGQLGAQTTLEGFLQRVAEESLYVEARRAEADARVAETRANNQLENPEIEYGYMPGIEQTEATRRSYSAIQSFDWPGAYTARRQINRLEREQAEVDFRQERQAVLLHAKQLCYELIYARKRQNLLDEQQARAESVLELTLIRLALGEATALDQTNARIGLARIRQEQADGLRTMENLKQQLDLLAGFNDFDPSGFDYAENPLENLNALIDQATQADPARQSAELASRKSEREIALARSATLPSFSIGVAGERISPTDSFLGISAGVSIPLWGGSGKVKAARSQQLAAQYRQRTVQSDTEATLREQAGTVRRLNESLALFDNLNEVRQGKQLLTTSLEQRQISVLEYYANLDFYTEMELEYLLLEWQLYRALADLTRFRL